MGLAAAVPGVPSGRGAQRSGEGSRAERTVLILVLHGGPVLAFSESETAASQTKASTRLWSLVCRPRDRGHDRGEPRVAVLSKGLKGGRRFVVVRWICDAAEPEAAARALRTAIDDRLDEATPS